MLGFLFSIIAIGLGFYEFKRLKKLIAVSKENSQSNPYAGFGLWQGYVFGGTLVFLGVLGIVNFIAGMI
ncbi:hypothetical protein ACYSNW_06580 [Enterococcus sp. LJL99]